MTPISIRWTRYTTGEAPPKRVWLHGGCYLSYGQILHRCIGMDVEACVRADLPWIGLLSAGNSRDELEKACATDVFEDCEDLRTHLHATRIGAPVAANS